MVIYLKRCSFKKVNTDLRGNSRSKEAAFISVCGHTIRQWSGIIYLIVSMAIVILYWCREARVMETFCRVFSLVWQREIARVHHGDSWVLCRRLCTAM